MSNKDVIVNISRETAAVTQAGFGLPLVISTEGVKAYGEYSDISAYTVDYSSSLKANKIAERLFGQSPSLPKISAVGLAGIGEGEGDVEDFIDALNEVAEMRNDFYFILCDTRDADLQMAISDWAAAKGKQYFTCVSDPDDLELFNSERTTVMAHTAPESYPEAAWVGACAPANPGSITWKFKNLNGIAAAEYTLTQISDIHAANGNTYVQKLGFLQTSAGKTSGGEYIDNIRSEDFIKSRLEEEVSRLLFSKGKVAYDNKGIALVVDAVRTVLRQATAQGIVALDDNGQGMFTITAPKRSEASVNDVANRVLNNVNWTAVLAGAVEKVTINGILTY